MGRCRKQTDNRSFSCPKFNVLTQKDVCERERGKLTQLKGNLKEMQL